MDFCGSSVIRSLTRISKQKPSFTFGRTVLWTFGRIMLWKSAGHYYKFKNVCSWKKNEKKKPTHTTNTLPRRTYRRGMTKWGYDIFLSWSFYPKSTPASLSTREDCRSVLVSLIICLPRVFTISDIIIFFFRTDNGSYGLWWQDAAYRYA